ncbi:hypothetical protein I5535_19425 [Rhodobacteraceae bacterium F11138]|nr:hypothetical protein [Rhodobacteraceae bacterium F11138]
MTCMTITTWELADGTDYEIVLRQVREKRLPALREMGASRVTVVRTSERTTAAIIEWPDEMTRDSAEQALQQVREKIHAEDLSRLTGEMGGEVVAQI